MGIINAIMILIIGVILSSAPGPGDQVRIALEFPEESTLQSESKTQQPLMETAQKDESTEDKKEEAIQSEKKESPSEAASPKASTEPKKGPPKDFVPTEKIPADQAVDFPTDI